MYLLKVTKRPGNTGENITFASMFSLGAPDSYESFLMKNQFKCMKLKFELIEKQSTRPLENWPVITKSEETSLPQAVIISCIVDFSSFSELLKAISSGFPLSCCSTKTAEPQD